MSAVGHLCMVETIILRATALQSNEEIPPNLKRKWYHRIYISSLSMLYDWNKPKHCFAHLPHHDLDNVRAVSKRTYNHGIYTADTMESVNPQLVQNSSICRAYLVSILFCIFFVLLVYHPLPPSPPGLFFLILGYNNPVHNPIVKDSTLVRYLCLILSFPLRPSPPFLPSSKPQPIKSARWISIPPCLNASSHPIPFETSERRTPTITGRTDPPPFGICMSTNLIFFLYLFPPFTRIKQKQHQPPTQ